MKQVFKITMMSTIPIFMIGYTLKSEWINDLACLIFAFAFGSAGIKGLVDPLNFDWDEFIVEIQVPTDPRSIKWYVAWIRLKCFGLLCISAFVFYFVIFGDIWKL
jgi:hypothetical protein